MTMTLIVIGFAVLVLIGLAYKDDPHEIFSNYIRRRKSEGATFKQAFSELMSMEAFVVLRRRASDLCIEQDGRISENQIGDIAGELAIGIDAAHGPKASAAFLAWVGQSDLTDILYDDAFDAMRKHVTIPKDTKLSDDMVAALRSL